MDTEAARLRERLQAALGSAYAIERELGGGGMSRVFVAVETALGRRVVVKVLPPDVAGEVSAERFRREIQLAARLRHPHILPVLTAGAADALLYYTMPFVEGESLRARLAREGALPPGETRRLLREVADALAYAHGHGVVHRDVKPENVLLESGHATVADFGVAKALAASSTTGGDAPAAGTFTTAGRALGTPAYMAPEQALGDPAADHRVDLYALGLVGYEMLAGTHPFAGRGSRAMIAAQITEPPPPLAARCPDAPFALVDVVTRLLAKDPDARPPSAAAVLAAIETPADRAGGVAPTPRRQRPIWWGVAAVAILLAAAGAVLAARTRSAARARGTAPTGVLVVADFEDHAHDSTLARTVVQALRIDLARSPRVMLPGAAEVRAGLAAMRADTAGPFTGELALALARRTGGAAVLDGAVYAAGPGYELTARLVAAASGRPVATFRESAADSSQVIAAIDRLSRAVRREVGESVASLGASPPLAAATTRSLPALTAFTRMVEAQSTVDWPIALDYGRKAVALDPEFAEAYRRIGNVLGNLQALRAEQVAAISHAWALRERLSPFEKGMAEATWYWQVRGDRRRAAERLGVLATEFPVVRDRRQPEANSDLAVVYEQLGEWELVLRTLQPLADSARFGWSGQARYVRALIGVGRLAAADSAVEAMGRVSPGPFAAYLRSGPALARRDYVSAFAHVAGALAFADSALGSTASRSGRVQSLLFQQRPVTAALGRLGARERIDATLAPEYERLGAGPEVLRTAAELAEVEAALGQPERAARRLEAALARHPLAPMAALDRPYPTLAAAWAAAGRADRARPLLAEWAREVPAENQPLDAIAVLRARIVTRLAEGRAADAERLARDGSFGACAACRDAYLARAFDAEGAADSAVAAWERYLAPVPGREVIDPTELARAYRRLGELYEARGDSRRAARRYQDLVELWRGADAVLQPTVDELRRRVKRLEAGAK